VNLMANTLAFERLDSTPTRSVLHEPAALLRQLNCFQERLRVCGVMINQFDTRTIRSKQKRLRLPTGPTKRIYQHFRLYYDKFPSIRRRATKSRGSFMPPCRDVPTLDLWAALAPAVCNQEEVFPIRSKALGPGEN
jgi:hypothetical protein